MAGAETILFVSHKRALCGVYEFGRSVADALQASRKFHVVFAECGGADDYHAAVAAHDPGAIIYNYHANTVPWIKRGLIGRHRGPHLGLMHEFTQRLLRENPLY